MYDLIITAAGSGSRFGIGYNKMLFEIDGKTLIEHSVLKFYNNPLFQKIIIVAASADLEEMQNILQKYSNIEYVVGGESRFESVKNGFEKTTTPYVFIHDGARIFITDDLINRLHVAITNEKYDGYSLAVKCTDTITKYNCQTQELIATLNRDELVNMQTPQVCSRESYQQAINKNVGCEYTDEMSLLIANDFKCKIVLSETYNKKITYLTDVKESDEH